MKKLISALLSLLLMIPCVGFAETVQASYFDFNDGAVPTELNITTAQNSNSSVVAADGMLKFTASNINGSTGVTGAKYAKAEIAHDGFRKYASFGFDYLQPDTNGTKYFGVCIDGTDYSILKISGGNCTVGEGTESVATISTNTLCNFYITVENNTYCIHLDGNAIFSGELSGIPLAEASAVFFNSRNTAKGKEAVFSIDNFFLNDADVYKAVCNIEDGSLMPQSDFESFTVSFDMPLKQKPQVSFVNDETVILANVTFKGNEIVAVPETPLEKMKQYTVKTEGIITADGQEQDDISVTFCLADDDYALPLVTIAAEKEIYRPNQAFSVEIDATSNVEIAKTELYVNDVLFDTDEAVSSFQCSFADVGDYVIFAKVYDALGGSTKSESITVSVIENMPPAVKLADLPETADISAFPNIEAEIEDDGFVETVVLYINGVESNATYTKDGNLYTFSGIAPIAGNVQIQVTATDNEGKTGEDSATVKITKSVLSTLSEIDYESGLTNTFFNYNVNKDSLGDTFICDTEEIPDKNGNLTNAMVIRRMLETDKTPPNPYPYVQYSSLTSGIARVTFDVLLSKNTMGLNFNLAGMKNGSSNWSVNVKMSGGKINLYDGKTVAASKDFTYNAWHTFVYTCNLDNKTYTLMLDDQLLTPSEGYEFAVPDLDTIGQLRFETAGLTVGDSAYYDNLKLEKQSSAAAVDKIETEKNKVTVFMTVPLNENTVSAENVALYHGNEKLLCSSVSYDADRSAIVLETQDKIITSELYKLIISENIQSTSGLSAGADMVQLFKSTPAEFDIIDFAFTASGEKVGAKATVQNLNPTDEKTAVMVMLLRDADGAVCKIISSSVVDCFDIDNPDHTSYEIVIDPSDLSGYTPEVVWINNWSDLLAIKYYRYKQ